jgi:hypothetical protein
MAMPQMFFMLLSIEQKKLWIMSTRSVFACTCLLPVFREQQRAIPEWFYGMAFWISYWTFTAFYLVTVFLSVFLG